MKKLFYTVAIIFAAILVATGSVLASLFYDGKGTVPKGVRVLSDVAYGSEPEQRMDVYIPDGAKDAPVILMVHGGAWRWGDKGMARMWESKVGYWVPKGVIFISINYRMVPKADPVTQADDVAAALAFAQKKAPEWGGDPTRFVLMGHSAGAHLIALISADPQIAVRQGAKPWLGAVVLDSGAYDVVAIMQKSHYGLFDSVFSNDPVYWKKASPTWRLTGKPQPMLLVCSTKRDDSCSQANDFAAKVEALGGRVSVLSEALSHREINETLGTDASYTAPVDAFMKTLGVP